MERTVSALEGRRIAILVADGFERDELVLPREALFRAGARAVVVSPNTPTVRAWKDMQWRDPVSVDCPLSEARADAFDALLLPGGVLSANELRASLEVRAFLKGFLAAARPIAVVGHAIWPLVDMGVVEGRTVTAAPSLRADLDNAGASFRDEPVVVDEGLVSCRGADDLPAFEAAMCSEFARGERSGRRVRIVTSVSTPKLARTSMGRRG